MSFGDVPVVGDMGIDNISAVRRIGHGGFADVYLGEQKELSRQVAVKVIREPQSESNRSVFTEAVLLAKLRHPNIMEVLSVSNLG